MVVVCPSELLGAHFRRAIKPDKDKSTFEQVVFHVDLVARGADQKAVKMVHKLDVLIKNEW